MVHVNYASRRKHPITSYDFLFARGPRKRQKDRDLLHIENAKVAKGERKIRKMGFVSC